MTTGGTSIIDLVKPKGNILNDSDSGVDYLGHSVYAEALAEKIDRVSTPITIGVFARWGSGKSFLLKHVRNLLERHQRQNNVSSSRPRRTKLWGWRCRCCFRTLLFATLLAIIIVSSLWAADPALFIPSLEHDVIADDQSSPIINISVPLNPLMTSKPAAKVGGHSSHFSRYVALAVLILTLVVIGVVVCGNNDWWSSEFHKNLRLVLFVAFTKLPIKSFEKAIIKETYDSDVMMKQDCDHEMEVKSNKKFIFVNFNAWEYAGSDTLWAGIITTLSNAVEAEFGSVTTRLFRMLKVRVMPRQELQEEVGVAKQALVFVRFPKPTRAMISDVLRQYGVVRSCTPRSQWKKYKDEEGVQSNWYVVQYSNVKEAHRAYESLSLKGVQVTFIDPCQSKPKEQSDSTSSRNAARANSRPVEASNNHGNHYETTVLMSHPPGTPPSQHSSSSASSSDSQPHDEDDEKPHSCVRHFMKYPKTVCNVPSLFWNILAVFALISLPVITYILADMLHLDVYRTGRAVPIVVQIVSWLPAVGAAAFVIMRFIWAMFHSQRNRINSALAGTKGNMATQLGFMNKVKTEVEYITRMLQCAEYSHNQQYKVVITIDDLDRCALDKIKSVLEAVSILLSDHSSPFVCLVAVDSRVAVKCIEDTMSTSLVKSNVNGHEYLKKIINLPFCLPEIDTKMKKHFITGLVDLADETRKSVVRKEGGGGANPPETPSVNRRLTIDSRPNYLQSDKPPNSLRLRSKDAGIMRSDTELSFSVTDNSDEGEASHLTRKASQLPLLPNMERNDHPPSRWMTQGAGDSRKTLPRRASIPPSRELLEDVPDGFPLTDGPKREIQSDTPTEGLIFIEDGEDASGQRRGSQLGDEHEASANNDLKPPEPVPVAAIVEQPGPERKKVTISPRDPHESGDEPPNPPDVEAATDPPQENVAPSPPQLEMIQGPPIRTSTFLYICRKYLYNNDVILRHVEGNPRNIKRIFNVLSLTSWILHCYQRERKKSDFLRNNCALHREDTEEATDCEVAHHISYSLPVTMSGRLAEDLVVWVVLTDQWPYRMSYLMEVLDDMEQRPTSEGEYPVDPDAPLADVYEKCVLPEMDKIHSKDEDGLLSMDIHPDMFLSFLKEIREHNLLRTKVGVLRRITINLDQSLRQTIVRQREGLMKRSRSSLKMSDSS